MSDSSNVDAGPTADLTDATPRDGDIVVAQEPSDPRRFTIRRLPDAPQMTWNSRDAAVDMARGFARQYLVDVWTVDGQTHTRLHHCRSNHTSLPRAAATMARPSVGPTGRTPPPLGRVTPVTSSRAPVHTTRKVASIP